VDEKFNEEETKFKMLEGAVKNVARDISIYLEQLDVSICTTCLHVVLFAKWCGVQFFICLMAFFQDNLGKAPPER